MCHVFVYSLSSFTCAIIITGSILQAQAEQINGSDVVINGESFFAASNITSELTRLARQDELANIIAPYPCFRQK